MMKLISWNVNGIRAILKKDFLVDVEKMQADIICLQETKAQDDQVEKALQSLEAYHLYANSAEKKGYSGVAVLTKIKPLAVMADIGLAEHDREGRVLTLEFETFYLVNVYTPNSGSELARLSYRQEWDKAFLEFVCRLEQKKPVVMCGDFNVAHTEIDLARPKANYNKSAGYMQEEIDGMDNILSAGFIDTFRWLYPQQSKYSWWSYRAGARARNVGWRIDYFITSQSLSAHIKNADILNDVFGSDHCPVLLELSLSV
jgi:exodeoxyribonuclease-3